MKAPLLKAAIMGNGMAQIPSSDEHYVPPAVNLQNASQLVLQVGNVVAHALLPKLAKVREVLADLGRAHPQPLGQILGCRDLDALCRHVRQGTQIHRQAADDNVWNGHSIRHVPSFRLTDLVK
jgi:hypothetical protein